MTPRRYFSSEEFIFLSNRLRRYHGIFNKMWDIGLPTFTNMLPTLAVRWDSTFKRIDVLINPIFWDMLNIEQKEFVYCHEMLHVLFYHGQRAHYIQEHRKANKDVILTKQSVNIAMDIVVNESLMSRFGVDPVVLDTVKYSQEYKDYKLKDVPKEEHEEALKEMGDYCKFITVDRVFPGMDIPNNKSLEYYYDLLIQQAQQNGNTSGSYGSLESFDDHDGLESFIDPEFEKTLKEAIGTADYEMLKSVIRKQLDSMSEEEKKEVVSKLKGNHPGQYVFDVSKYPKVVKRKWETIIKNWSLKYLRDKEEDIWVGTHRNHTLLSENMDLPNVKQQEVKKKDKIEVWFFQDTSGSCVHLVDRFFKAAMSLPEDKFTVRLFTFDTSVYPVRDNKRIEGGGGTSFSILEDYVHSETNRKCLPYPRAVFVITDGYGDAVKPKFPKNWHWFLTEDGNSECIDDACNIYDLAKFE